MDLLRKARELEAKLAGRVDRAMGGLVRSSARDPLEIAHAAVEAARGEIQSSGRGRRVFPFNTMAMTILAPTADARARFEAVFGDGTPLRDRIVAQLESAGCRLDDLDLTINYDTRARKNWKAPEFHIEFARIAKPAPEPVPEPAAKKAEPGPAPPRIEVTVLNGTADRRSYALTGGTRIDIGRCAEVRDSRHHLIRTNHIAFVDRSGDANQTVSRRHAHISYDPPTKSFRLHDDGSEHGTGIVRNGRSLPVPRGTRGVRLESADEIVLGDARLRVKFP